MKSLNRWIALIAAMTLFGSSTPRLDGLTYCTDAGGCGYQECRTVPCLSPVIALSAIALAAIIAVALQKSKGSSDHAHSHC